MPAGSLEHGFSVGPHRVDPASRTVTGPGGAVHRLSERQSAVLLHLAQHPATPVARSDLLARDFPPGASDAALDNVIHALRVALDDLAHPRLLITAPRNGYMLVDIHTADSVVVPTSVASASGSSSDSPPSQAFREVILAWLRQPRWKRVLVALGSSGGLLLAALATVNDAMQLFGLPRWVAIGVVGVLAALTPLLAAIAFEFRAVGDHIVRDRVGLQADRPLPGIWRTAVPALLLSGAMVAALLQEFPPPAPPGSDLILVLPFRALDPAATPPGFGEGIADDLIYMLTLNGLRVVSYTALTDEQRELPAPKLGKMFGVAHVVDGSIRQDAGVTVITLQLLETVHGVALHSSRDSDREGQLVDLPMRLGRELVIALGHELVPAAEASFRVARTDQNEAYMLYYQALALTRGAGDPSRILDAESLLRKALAIDPKFAAAHAQLCRLNLWKYERDRDPAMLQVAERYCEVARRLDPTPETGKAIAGFYAVSGEHDKAETLYRALLEANPKDAELLVGLGDVLAAQRRWDEAERDFRRAVEVEPDRWMAHNSLGRFLWQRRRIDEAAAAFEAGLRVAPNSALTLNNLGSMWLYEGNFERAGAAFERALEIEPVKPAYSNLGSVRFYAGDFAAAETLFRKAVELAGNDWQPRVNLAEALWHLPERRADALAEYRVAASQLASDLERNPAPERAALLAVVEARLGATAEADRRAAEALRLGPEHPEVQFYVATLAMDRGDPAAALTALRRAVELGYPQALVRAAPDFRSLHDKPEFKRLGGSTDTR